MQLPDSSKLFLFSLKLFLTAVILFVLSATASYAQQEIKQHKVKDRIELGSGQSLEILQMRGAGTNEEWYVQYYRGKDAESTPRWEYSEGIKNTEQRLLDAKKPAVVPPVTNTPPKTTDDKLKQKDNNTVPVAANNTNCTYTPPAPEVVSTDKFSVELAKRKIYDTYARNANGTGVAPLKVGVTFLSFSTGTPYKNTVSVYGARRYDGAPAGVTLYPVFSKHITCEQYRDATNRASVESSFVCFKDKDGNWICPILGFPKTTSL